MNLDLMHPCVGCKHFDICGDESMTETCNGRESKEENNDSNADTEKCLATLQLH